MIENIERMVLCGGEKKPVVRDTPKGKVLVFWAIGPSDGPTEFQEFKFVIVKPTMVERLYNTIMKVDQNDDIVCERQGMVIKVTYHLSKNVYDGNEGLELHCTEISFRSKSSIRFMNMPEYSKRLTDTSGLRSISELNKVAEKSEVPTNVVEVKPTRTREDGRQELTISKKEAIALVQSGFETTIRGSVAMTGT